jgi:hypothetical protein
LILPPAANTAIIPAMGILRRRPRPDHDPGVVYVFEKAASYATYYSAVCRCGWFAEPIETRYPDLQAEEQMAAAARAHSPNADVNVAFPLDRPT